MKILQGAQNSFSIEVDGIIVGAGNVTLDEDNPDSMPYLERIDIDAGHRGKGYGTAALEALTEIYGALYLAPDNEDSKRLFERVGSPMNANNLDAYGFAADQGFGVYEIPTTLATERKRDAQKNNRTAAWER